MNTTGQQRRARKTRLRLAFPFSVVGLLVAFALVFPDLVLLLFVAVLIVYLIEPVVARIARLSLRGRLIPRWVAVVVVFTTMFGSTVGGVAVFAPMLAREAGSLANEVPDFVRMARTEVLPKLSSSIEELQALFAPSVSAEEPVMEASGIVGRAADEAALEALLLSALSIEERALYQAGALRVDTEVEEADELPVLFIVQPRDDGSLAVRTGDEELFIRAMEGGEYLVSSTSRNGGALPPAGVDLERAFTDSLSAAVENSGQEVAEVLQLSQRLVGKLLSAVVAILVTFMVAAFISVDVPRIVRALEGLFPGEERDSAGRLLSRLNQGLSGVIRGQISICLINAVLTGIGLVILDVKFALLLAVLAGIGSLIPIFGAVVSSIPALIIALTQGVGTMLLVLLWILGIHFIEANVLQPKIMGRTARIHPAIIILALLAGEHAYGVLGALVAVPMASVLQSLLLFVREQYSRAVERDVGSSDPVAVADVEGETAHSDEFKPE
jgi:predicted PurR-regulated permease PerM